jgi:polyisoprenoid-binding protein YceI
MPQRAAVSTPKIRCLPLLHGGPPMIRMRPRFLMALAVVLLPAPLYAQPTGWQIDPQHTSIQFAVSHMQTSTVHGRFDKVNGTVKWDGGEFTSASVEIVTEVASINTGVPKRDEHLRTADFLQVEKFPTITFRSRKIEPAGPGKLRMIGDLTIRGVTRPVTFDVSGPKGPVKGPDGETRIGASATTTIDRRDFGLRWNRILEAGGLLVGFQVAITIEIELVNR